MPLIKDQAIVLRRLDYSETSQILAVWTRDHGKVRVIAKGARRSSRKRFLPGIDLLEAGDLVFSVRRPRQEALAIVTEWKAFRPFTGLRGQLNRLQAAQYVADAVVQLTEDWDPHPALYEGLYGTLTTLSGVDRVLPAVVSFQRTLLERIGAVPRFGECVGCSHSLRRTGDIYFSSFEGGLLCRDCEPARVEKRLVTVSWPVLCGGPPESDADLSGMFDLFNYHISHLMGRPAAAERDLVRLARESMVPKQ